MTRRITAALLLAMMTASMSALAQESSDSENVFPWQKMDANQDGKISREEYLRYHESLWNSFKKNDQGMLELKDLKPGQRARKSTEWEGTGRSQ
jgi:Spy/CpxP family protein refolding chaperone